MILNKKMLTLTKKKKTFPPGAQRLNIKTTKDEHELIMVEHEFKKISAEAKDLQSEEKELVEEISEVRQKEEKLNE